MKMNEDEDFELMQGPYMVLRVRFNDEQALKDFESKIERKIDRKVSTLVYKKRKSV